MVSLLKLAQVTEEGVRFLSPHDGTPMYVLIAFMLSIVSNQAPQVTHSGTFHITPELHRLRHHHATRRRNSHNIS